MKEIRKYRHFFLVLFVFVCMSLNGCGEEQAEDETVLRIANWEEYLDEGGWDADETILVQGIIDAYFYEKDEIILVDYKTDRIGPGGAAELVRKYKVQLDNYAEALERLTHRKVKEKIIYSFSLGRELLVETQDHEQLSFDFK